MMLDPALRELGEELKQLDADRTPELTAEQLLRPTAVPIVLTDRAPTHTVTHIRWLSAAAAIVAAVLVWRATGSGDEAAVVDRPPPERTTIVGSPTTVVGGDGPVPLASWTFDSPDSEQVAEVGGISLTLGDGATSVPGRSGAAVAYPGTFPSAAVARGPVIDTTRSFTVSTVIQASELRDCLYQGLVSQDGAEVSGFELGLTPGCSPEPAVFMFVMYDADADTAVAHRLVGASTVTAGRWYHVVGVHDAERQELRLYVDGELEATGPAPSDPWDAKGAFAVGRARFSAQLRDYFSGTIDTTAVYQEALTDAQVAAL